MSTSLSQHWYPFCLESMHALCMLPKSYEFICVSILLCLDNPAFLGVIHLLRLLQSLHLLFSVVPSEGRDLMKMSYFILMCKICHFLHIVQLWVSLCKFLHPLEEGLSLMMAERGTDL